MEEATGGRVHFMFNRVGGLEQDVPGGLARELRPPRSQRYAGSSPQSSSR